MTNNIHFVKCYVDGGVIAQNPSPKGVYWSVRIEGATERPVSIRKRSPMHRTNNEAEYLALREVLQWLVDHEVRWPIIVYSDSKTVVNQFNGTNQCNVPALIAMRDECRAVAAKLKGTLLLTLAGAVNPRTGARVEQPRAMMVRKLGH